MKVNILTKYKSLDYKNNKFCVSTDLDGRRTGVGPWEEGDHSHDNVFRLEVVDTGPGMSTVNIKMHVLIIQFLMSLLHPFAGKSIQAVHEHYSILSRSVAGGTRIRIGSL